jgi:hypothetical protein
MDGRDLPMFHFRTRINSVPRASVAVVTDHVIQLLFEPSENLQILSKIINKEYYLRYTLLSSPHYTF